MWLFNIQSILVKPIINAHEHSLRELLSFINLTDLVKSEFKRANSLFEIILRHAC